MEIFWSTDVLWKQKLENYRIGNLEGAILEFRDFEATLLETRVRHFLGSSIWHVFFQILISFPAAKKTCNKRELQQKVGPSNFDRALQRNQFYRNVFVCTFPKLLRTKVAWKSFNNLIAPYNKYVYAN